MSYVIAGRKVASEYLALATIGAVGGGVFLATRGGSKEKAEQKIPPINATSQDEEAFIKQFIAEAEAESKKTHK